MATFGNLEQTWSANFGLMLDGTLPNQTRDTERRLTLEAIEDESAASLAATPIVVTTLADISDPTDNQTSLREAVTLANATAGADEITFDAALAGGTLRLVQGALEITEDVHISGDLDGPGNANVGIGLTLSGDATGNGRSADDSRIFTVTTGTLELSSLKLDGGYTQDNGGLVDIGLGGAFTSTFTEFTNGFAAGYGGAIHNAGGALNLAFSTIAENEAFAGGGIASASSTDPANIVASTIAANRASYGGGIASFDFQLNQIQAVTLIESTVTDNTALRQGGGVFSVLGGELRLGNSILSGNTAPDASDEIYGISFTPDNGNVDRNIVGNTIFNGTAQAGTTSTAEIFSALTATGGGAMADNGGPTRTVALAANLDNPAIDAANDAAMTGGTDQRLFLRPTDIPGVANNGANSGDLGAFEVQDVTLSLEVTTLADIVDPNDTELSLREAVSLANETDGAVTITFRADLVGTLRLTQGEIEITDTLTINGDTRITVSGDAAGNDVTEIGTDFTDIDASAGLLADNTRLFNVTDANAAAEFRQINLTGGVAASGDYAPAGGGAIASAASLTFYEAQVTGNLAKTGSGYGVSGGAVFTEGALTIRDSQFLGNRVIATFDGSGGAVAARGAIDLDASIFSDNSVDAQYSGSGGSVSGAGTVTTVESTFEANIVSANGSANGGAIASFGALSIEGSSFTGNRAEGQGASGGAVSVSVSLNRAEAEITNATFTDNAADVQGGYGGGGGAIHAGALTLTGSTLTGNQTFGSSASGGALISDGPLIVSDSTFELNATSGYRSSGGAVASSGTTLVANSSFGANGTAGVYSGGGAIAVFGDLSLYNSTITGNVASATLSYGGGIYSGSPAAGPINVSNAIIAGNATPAATGAPLSQDLYAGPQSAVSLNGGVIMNGAMYRDGISEGPVDLAQVFDATASNAGVVAGTFADNGGLRRTLALKADLANPAIDAGLNDLIDENVTGQDLNGDGDTGDVILTDGRGVNGIARNIDTSGIGSDPARTVDLGAYELGTSASNGPDILIGTDGVDNLAGLGGNDLLLATSGNDTLDGSAGTDTVSFGLVDTPPLIIGSAEFGVFANLSQQGASQSTNIGDITLIGIENLEGTPFSDLLTGDAEDNLLRGGDGGDLLFGGDGNDTIEGGGGFDAIEGGTGADLIFGGDGFGDVATYFGATGPLTFVFGATLSDAEAGSSTLVAEDTIGSDIEGILGSTTFSNTFDASIMAEVTFFVGGKAADTFFGGSATDQLVALEGDDEIHGNAGIDALNGGGGDDDLFGGAGADIFFFDGTDDADTIHDFELGADLIFFTGTAIASKGQLSFDTVDADGDLLQDDGIAFYEVNGATSSITVLNVDGSTLESDATVFNVI